MARTPGVDRGATKPRRALGDGTSLVAPAIHAPPDVPGAGLPQDENLVVAFLACVPGFVYRRGLWEGGNLTGLHRRFIGHLSAHDGIGPQRKHDSYSNVPPIVLTTTGHALGRSAHYNARPPATECPPEHKGHWNRKYSHGKATRPSTATFSRHGHFIGTSVNGSPLRCSHDVPSEEKGKEVEDDQDGTKGPPQGGSGGQCHARSDVDGARASKPCGWCGV